MGLILKFHSTYLPELLSTTDHSNDFFFDLIGESFFHLSTLDSANLDNSVPNPSSWLTNLEDFVFSNKNKQIYSILILIWFLVLKSV